MSHGIIDFPTNLQVCEKQPSDNRLFRIDMRNKLGESPLASVISIVSTPQGLVTDTNPLQITGATYGPGYFECRIAAGTASENYKLTAKGTTVSGDTVEADVMLYVRER